MSDRIEELVRQAAPNPEQPVDPVEVWSWGLRMRRRRQVATGLAAVVVLSVGLVVFQPWPIEQLHLADSETAAEGHRRGLAVLDRPEAPKDQLPARAQSGLFGFEAADVERARLASREDGVSYYLVQLNDGPLCMVAYEPSSQLGVSGCGTLEQAISHPGALAMGGGVIAGSRRYVGVIPDDFDVAVAGERSWSVEGNLLVISDEPIPMQVDVRGAAGSHPVDVHSLFVDPPDEEPAFHVDELYEDVTPATVAGSRVFIVLDGDEVTVFLARAQHLDDEGLWWCPNEQVFVSPSHGELFDRQGRAWDGPAKRDLDRLPARLEGDRVYVSPQPIRAGEARGASGSDDASDVLSGSALDAYRSPPWEGRFCVGHRPDDPRPGW